MSTTRTVLALVRSAFAYPGDDPYCGRIEVPADARTVDEVLDGLFHTCNINHPAGWQQPSMSSGDVVYLWMPDEGHGMIYVAVCQPIGWTWDELPGGETRCEVVDAFMTVDPEYAGKVTAWTARRDQLAERSRQRREAELAETARLRERFGNDDDPEVA